ncbi:hypothetical protein TgHK011_006358 [Trichoderma gracile]|nr:hypothetical protein TgHK011_006358 [Trichoderma gracile]
MLVWQTPRRVRRGQACYDGALVFIRTRCLSGVTAASRRRADDEARRGSEIDRVVEVAEEAGACVWEKSGEGKRRRKLKTFMRSRELRESRKRWPDGGRSPKVLRLSCAVRVGQPPVGSRRYQQHLLRQRHLPCSAQHLQRETICWGTTWGYLAELPRQSAEQGDCLVPGRCEADDDVGDWQDTSLLGWAGAHGISHTTFDDWSIACRPRHVAVRPRLDKILRTGPSLVSCHIGCAVPTRIAGNIWARSSTPEGSHDPNAELHYLEIFRAGYLNGVTKAQVKKQSARDETETTFCPETRNSGSAVMGGKRLVPAAVGTAQVQYQTGSDPGAAMSGVSVAEPSKSSPPACQSCGRLSAGIGAPEQEPSQDLPLAAYSVLPPCHHSAARPSAPHNQHTPLRTDFIPSWLQHVPTSYDDASREIPREASPGNAPETSWHPNGIPNVRIKSTYDAARYQSSDLFIQDSPSPVPSAVQTGRHHQHESDLHSDYDGVSVDRGRGSNSRTLLSTPPPAFVAKDNAFQKRSRRKTRQDRAITNPNEKITLKSTFTPGLFVNGRSSAPVADLVFNEIPVPDEDGEPSERKRSSDSRSKRTKRTKDERARREDIEYLTNALKRLKEDYPVPDLLGSRSLSILSGGDFPSIQRSSTADIIDDVASAKEAGLMPAYGLNGGIAPDKAGDGDTVRSLPGGHEMQSHSAGSRATANEAPFFDSIALVTPTRLNGDSRLKDQKTAPGRQSELEPRVSRGELKSCGSQTVDILDYQDKGVMTRGKFPLWEHNHTGRTLFLKSRSLEQTNKL